MTRQEKIGINYLFKRLKELGVLERYVNNYMKYHHLSSPLLIPETISKKGAIRYGIEGLILEKAEQERWNSFFVANFGNYFVSFCWSDTPEGHGFWSHICDLILFKTVKNV